jgi:hypothetical protein
MIRGEPGLDALLAFTVEWQSPLTALLMYLVAAGSTWARWRK